MEFHTPYNFKGFDIMEMVVLEILSIGIYTVFAHSVWNSLTSYNNL